MGNLELLMSKQRKSSVQVSCTFHLHTSNLQQLIFTKFSSVELVKSSLEIPKRLKTLHQELK
jgi:hypothetical protein